MSAATIGWPVFPTACAIATSLVLLAAPRTRVCRTTDIAQLTVARLANEAFPQWSAAHPEVRCPANIEALMPWMNSGEAIDPWGRDYRYFCITQPGRPARVLVWSAGPDRRHGTSDDIRSER
jgi:hypothetical protein